MEVVGLLDHEKRSSIIQYAEALLEQMPEYDPETRLKDKTMPI